MSSGALPELPQFLKLAAANPGRLIPVVRRFLADSLTPVAAFRRLPPSPYAFLLESVERGDRIGRYSLVGSCPELVFRGTVLPEPTCTIERPGGEATTVRGDPLRALEEYLRSQRAADDVPGVPVPPFSGGAIGYLGYDLVRLIEPRLLARPPRDPGIPGVPDLCVPIYHTLLIFDHVLKTATVAHYADPGASGGPRAAYARALEALERVVASLRAGVVEPFDEMVLLPEDAPDLDLRSNCTPGEYRAAVTRAKEYIGAGDIIQVVLSQRLSCRTKAHPFEVYRSLRAINPSPYMFYLKFGDLHLVGSSPEVLVRVENGLITVRPIAGTRRRGRDPAEDAALARELAADPKERAEHVMLVDLGRNDIGRVAEFGSVRVDERLTVENYSHVMHLVSNVSGRMKPELNAFEVFRACLPAGTLSGAPKIRAMEIIDELETDRRGPYGGAVGMLDFRGNLNTAIVIRTFVMQARDGAYDAHLQAGAGIVADSVPALEYDETMNKARALLRALSATEARLATQAAIA